MLDNKVLKRKEKEFQQEMQRLTREKIATQDRIMQLRRELTLMNIDFDINYFMTSQDQETNSTSTASGTILTKFIFQGCHSPGNKRIMGKFRGGGD